MSYGWLIQLSASEASRRAFEEGDPAFREISLRLLNGSEAKVVFIAELFADGCFHSAAILIADLVRALRAMLSANFGVSRRL